MVNFLGKSLAIWNLDSNHLFTFCFFETTNCTKLRLVFSNFQPCRYEPGTNDNLFDPICIHVERHIQYQTSKDKKARNALKAKLRRLCQKKKGDKLQVPEWAHEMWKNGNHLKLALEYQKAGFCKDP